QSSGAAGPGTSSRSAHRASCRGRHDRLPDRTAPPIARFPTPRRTDVVALAYYDIPPCAQHHRSCVVPSGPVRTAVPWDCRHRCHFLPVHSRDHPVRAVLRARDRNRRYLLHAEHRADDCHRHCARARRSLNWPNGSRYSMWKESSRVDLPTYTNILRIEKRLYKLYDFRLPMPLPVGQLAVFAVIAVPYVVVLTMLGLSFGHTLLWLYVLPPAVLTWLATRPVIESKRLPELVHSQLRYLTEPRTWCRLAPLAEKDEITVTCRVWRQTVPPLAVPADAQALAVQPALRPGVVQAAEILALEPPGIEMAAAEAPAVEEAPVESLVPEASAPVAPPVEVPAPEIPIAQIQHAEAPAAEVPALEPPAEVPAAEVPAEFPPADVSPAEAPALSGSVAEMVARAVAMWPVADQARATVAPPLVKAAGVAAPVMVAPADHTPPTEPEPAPAGPAPEPEPEVSQAEAPAVRAPEPAAPHADVPPARAAENLAPEPEAPEVEVPAATVPAVSQPLPLHAAEQASRPVVT